MNWETLLVAFVGGIGGGIVVGTVQVFMANVIVGWRRRSAQRREDRMKKEIAREWCENCGQRLGAEHPDICMPGVE